jgi:hypothetical protein
MPAVMMSQEPSSSSIVLAAGRHPARRAILPIDHAADAQAAREADSVFQKTLGQPGLADADIAAARAVVAVAVAHRGAVNRSFGEYLFARIAAPVLRAYAANPRPAGTGSLMGALFGLLSSDMISPELRDAILDGAAHLARNANSAGLRRDVGRALLHELIAGRGESRRMVDVLMVPVLFDARGKAVVSSLDVVSDPARRAAAIAALQRVGSSPALRVAAWLGPGERVRRSLRLRA